MLKNNKGFMLAEAVVTATIVLTSLVSFYAIFTKLYSAYEIRSRYYDIDGIYASKSMINHLITSTNATSNLNNILSTHLQTNNYIYLIKNEDCNSTIITECINSNSEDSLYIKALKNHYQIKNMILMEWSEDIVFEGDKSIIKNDSNINETFKEYLKNYVVKHYDFSRESGYNYLIITEYKKENTTKEEYNYSSINLR